MLNKIIYILIFSLIGTALYSQSTIAQYDSTTYMQYRLANWKQLIKTGKEANKKGITFYYLSYRMGIAYYEQHNFAKAIPYFEKVLETNTLDPFVYNYLYYSYLETSQYRKAEALKKAVPAHLKVSFNTAKESTIQSISSIYTNAKFDTGHLKNTYLKGADSTYGEMPLVPIQNSSISFYTGIHPLPMLHINISGTQLWSTNFQRFSHKENNYYFENSAEQKQMYLQVQSETVNGWKFSVAGHLLSVKTTYYIAWSDTSYLTINSVVKKETTNETYYINTDYLNIPNYTVQTKKESMHSNDYLFHAGISKSNAFWNATLGGAYSSLLGTKIMQADAAISVYPFGNNRTQISSGIIAKKQLHTSENIEKQWNCAVSKQVSPHASLFIAYKYGQIHNYSEYEGNVIYNTDYNIKKSLETGITLSFFKNKLYWFSSFELKEFESAYLYSQETSKKLSTKQIEYFTIWSNSTNQYIGEPIIEDYPYEEPQYSIKQEYFRFTNYILKTGLTWYF